MPGPEIPRLSPAPLHLLVAMARGACLRRYDSVSPFFLMRPPGLEDEFESFQRLHARAPRRLIALSLVEPVDKFDWRISASGLSWLAANEIAAKSEKQVRPFVTFRGK